MKKENKKQTKPVTGLIFCLVCPTLIIIDDNLFWFSCFVPLLHSLHIQIRILFFLSVKMVRFLLRVWQIFGPKLGWVFVLKKPAFCVYFDRHKTLLLFIIEYNWTLVHTIRSIQYFCFALHPITVWCDHFIQMIEYYYGLN